jgi:hypothetical protein
VKSNVKMFVYLVRIQFGAQKKKMTVDWENLILHLVVYVLLTQFVFKRISIVHVTMKMELPIH